MIGTRADFSLKQVIYALRSDYLKNLSLFLSKSEAFLTVVYLLLQRNLRLNF